jgi:hypothetical protein
VDKRIVAADGIELLAESVGDSANPAVQLIMGAMASGVWWPDEFCRRLAGRGRFVIRIDHRDDWPVIHGATEGRTSDR